MLVQVPQVATNGGWCIAYVNSLSGLAVVSGNGFFRYIKTNKDSVSVLVQTDVRQHMLREVRDDLHFGLHAEILRLIALTGCRRGEIISLRWSEVDIEGSCLRLKDSKEGASVRPVGLPVINYFEAVRLQRHGTYVFPGHGEDNAVGNFPKSWKKLFEDTPLWDVTPHVLRHSFASIANDLGFTEITIAALIGHAKG